MTHDETVAAARTAFVELFRLMMLHRLDFEQLTVLLEKPPIVETAYDFWVARMADVFNSLARDKGVENPAGLSDRDKAQLTAQAYALVMGPDTPRLIS